MDSPFPGRTSARCDVVVFRGVGKSTAGVAPKSPLTETSFDASPDCRGGVQSLAVVPGVVQAVNDATNSPAVRISADALRTSPLSQLGGATVRAAGKCRVGGQKTILPGARGRGPWRVLHSRSRPWHVCACSSS